MLSVELVVMEIIDLLGNLVLTVGCVECKL